MQKITILIATVLLAACHQSVAGGETDSSTTADQTPTTSPTPGAPNDVNEGDSKPCYDMSNEACQTFYLTNRQREQNGLPDLVYSHRCFEMAQEQSQDMASYHYFDHQRPAESNRAAETFAQRAARFGVANGVGENIAMAQSAAQTVQMWMNSPGHRANILNPKYKSFAVGYQDGLYTQDFWVNVESP